MKTRKSFSLFVLSQLLVSCAPPMPSSTYTDWDDYRFSTNQAEGDGEEPRISYSDWKKAKAQEKYEKKMRELYLKIFNLSLKNLKKYSY